MTNRFLLLDRSLNGSTPRGRSHGGGIAAQASKKKSKCTQFSELAIDDDEFVLDVLQFFFDERLEVAQLNDDLRSVAARVASEATKASKKMALIPRPPATGPSLVWLVSEGVQIAFRAAQNKCIRAVVQTVVTAFWRTEYELARDGVMSMSLPMNGSASGGPVPHLASTGSMTVSPKGFEMIANFERFSAQPYTDAASDCRIGFGHLIHQGPCDGSEPADLVAGISEDRARELLRARIAVAERVVNRVAPIAFAQHRFDALASVAVNVGETAFEASRIAELLSTGRADEVTNELLLWVNGDGVPIPALVTRRKAEAKLYSSGVYPGAAEATAVEKLGIDLTQFETGVHLAGEMQAGTDWCQIRHNIIRSAVEMQGEWLVAGGLMDESASDALPLLVKFWEVGVGMDSAQANAVAALSAADHPSQAYWSAAFISWCVRNAMPNPPPPHDGGFRYHMRHMAYIAQAARNRAAADASRPFWLFDINDPDIVPEDGDIICLNRSGTSHSFASVNTNWVTNDPTSTATGSSHTDIVIGHFDHGGRQWIETVGGNVGDTVGSRYYSIDGIGRLVDQVRLDGTMIAGKSDVTQTVGNRAPAVFALIRLTACPDFG